MGPAQPTIKGKRAAFTGWVWRMVLGGCLIALSLWGSGFCQGLFRTFLGTSVSPVDRSFVKLAAWAAWFVFFGPIAALGLGIVWFTLVKLNVLERLQALREEKIGQGIHLGDKRHGSRSFRSQEDLHDGLEGLGHEKAAQLTKRAHQTAIVLGLCVGAFFVLIGVFGLMLATLRLTIYFAISSAISILAGLAILQRTLRKEDNAWLLPLKLFTQQVLRLHSRTADGQKTRRSEHAP